MTDEEALVYVKYATKAYKDYPYRRKACGDNLNDFIQDFVLFGLENPDKSQRYVFGRLVFRGKLQDWQKPVEYAVPFSALSTDEGHDNIDFLKELSCEDEIEDEADDYLLSQILEVLYPDNPESQERLLDYLYGSTFGHVKGAKCSISAFRHKIFNHRFIILRLMHDSGYLSDSDYDYYNTLAKSIDRPISKPLKNTPEAIYQRNWRAKHKKESHT